jgi:hypothetical protein
VQNVAPLHLCSSYCFSLLNAFPSLVLPFLHYNFIYRLSYRYFYFSFHFSSVAALLFLLCSSHFFCHVFFSSAILSPSALCFLNVRQPKSNTISSFLPDCSFQFSFLESYSPIYLLCPGQSLYQDTVTTFIFYAPYREAGPICP